MSEIDSIIQKYLQGTASEEEIHQLWLWSLQSKENKEKLFAEKDIWDTLSLHSNQRKYEVEIELELLNQQIKQRKVGRTRNLTGLLKIAAILLIAFGLGWFSQFISRSITSPAQEAIMQEIFVPKGQVNMLFLADGTKIWINSETRLVVPSVFEAKERVVKLNGEAFFEVAKDKKRPFKVNVNGQQIEVLGTSFNIRAYDNSNEIETTLETGQVKLYTGNQTTLLKPGEQCLFNKVDKQLIISNVNPATFSSWKDGRYEFKNEDLIEVFKVIERWYDVEIIADEAYFKGMRFSGVIKRNKDVKHFLELLNLTIPIRYELRTDIIKISHR